MSHHHSIFCLLCPHPNYISGVVMVSKIALMHLLGSDGRTRGFGGCSPVAWVCSLDLPGANIQRFRKSLKATLALHITLVFKER